jgi:AcrR family transcriptional regulator
LKAALVEMTLAQVRKQGVEGVSLREIAALVGVSPSAAYRHFVDKGALLAEVARAGFAHMAEATDAALRAATATLASDPAVAQLQAVGYAYANFALANPEHFQVMFGPYGAGRPAGHETLRGTASDGRDPFQQFIDALAALESRQRLRVTVAAGADLLAWSFVHGLAQLLIGGVLGPLDAQQARALVKDRVALFISLLVKPQEASPT